MSRSAKKGPYVDERLHAKVLKAKENGDHKPIKTWSRACAIHPDFIGVYFDVHNGKKFIRLFVNEDMVGHKFGEFAPTRTFKGHTGVKEKK